MATGKRINSDGTVFPLALNPIGGNVGIGTTAPGSKLQVNGNAAIGYSAATAGPANGLAVSGNVGIGTTAPQSLFQVYGGGGVANLSAETGMLKVTNSSANELSIGTNPGAPFEDWIQVKRSNNSGNWYPLALQPAGGNVGIGTTAPANNLHLIATSSSTAGLKIESSTNDSTLSLKNTSAGGREWWLGSGGNGAGGGPNFYIYDYTNNGVRMAINSDGNVGIGSTAPTQALDVNETVRAAHVSITGSSCSWSGWACSPTCAAGYYQAGTMLGAANNCNGTGPNVQIYCCSF